MLYANNSPSLILITHILLGGGGIIKLEHAFFVLDTPLLEYARHLYIHFYKP